MFGNNKAKHFKVDVWKTTTTEVYLGHCQISMMMLFTKIVDG